MEVGKELLESVYKRVDAPGLVSDTLDNILEPALENLVNGTDTTLDNVLKAAIYPALAAELKKLSKEYWDKLLGPAPVVPTPAPGA